MDKESVKIRVQTVYIRVRGWVMMLVQMLSIGLFLLGVYVIRESRNASTIDPTVLGYEVPALLGMTAFETMQYGGIAIMMVGLALSFRMVLGRSTPSPTGF